MNTISYHCLTHKNVQVVLNYFYDLGYTFNGAPRTIGLGTDEMDGSLGVLIHVKHSVKDMGYDYYYLDRPEKLESISQGRNVVEVTKCGLFFREEKLKRILK